jgi:flagellar biosynthesis protein FlhB
VAEEDRDDRTEQPSDRRLSRAFEEGKLPLGRDAVMLASMVAGSAALAMLGPAIRAGLVRAVAESVRALPRTPFSLLSGLTSGPALAALGVCAAAGLAGVAATVAQTRGGIWPHLALPDVSRLWAGGRLNLLRKDIWIDLAASAVKVAALAWVAWSALRADFLTLPALLGASPSDQLAQTFRIIGRIGLRLLAVSLVIAGADFALQRWRFRSSMKMTREELKREGKEDEGDPSLKGRRRKRHRELARGRAVVEVPRADALVVNPTHVAIAIRYRRDEGRAPRVTAKGKGALAEFMRDLARQNAVPIVQDVPLARLLYRKVKVGSEVPASTYKAVAAVLAFVYRLTGRAPQAPSGVRA